MKLKNPIWILLVPVIFQIFICTRLGLGVDEAHYMLYASHLDWSYFDHPPLVGWTHWLFNFIFGWNEFSARLPSILLGLVTSLLCFRYLQRKGFSKIAALYGAFSLSFCFLIFSLNLFLLPDTFLLPLVFVLYFCVRDVEKKENLKSWLSLGLVLGVAGLAKYTAVLFVIPVAWYLIEKKGWRIFLNKFLYLSLLTAAVLISPVLIWNFKHDWISFAYQINHISGDGYRFEAFLTSLAGQIGGYNPLLFGFAVVGFLYAFRHRRSEFRFEFLFLVTVLIFFVKASFGEPILPHWTSPFFILAVPIGVAQARARKYFKIALGISAAVFLLIGIELSFHCFPVPPIAYRDVLGFPQVAEAALKHMEDMPGGALAVRNWTFGSRLRFYTHEVRESFVLDDRKDQFDLWEDASPKGRDLLIVLFSSSNDNLDDIHCMNKDLLTPLDVKAGEQIVYTVQFLRCRGFQN